MPKQFPKKPGPVIMAREGATKGDSAAPYRRIRRTMRDVLAYLREETIGLDLYKAREFYLIRVDEGKYRWFQDPGDAFRYRYDSGKRQYFWSLEGERLQPCRWSRTSAQDAIRAFPRDIHLSYVLIPFHSLPGA